MKRIMMTGWMMLAMGFVLSAGATPIFVDSFTNNVVTNSDSVNGFWVTSTVGTGATGTAVESGGKLTLTGAATNLASTSVQITHGLDSQFNFFNSTGLTFSANIATAGNVGGEAAKVWYRFILSSVGSNISTDDDVIFLNQKATGAYYVRTKSNGGAAQNPINITANTKMISSFSMSVNNTDLILSLIFADASTTNFNIAHGMAAGSWGAAGNAAMTLVTGRDTITNATVTSIMTVNDFTVTKGMIPEPATIGLFALSGITVLGIRRMVRR